MHKNNILQINCLEIEQPIGHFYIGVINWNDLEYISKADVRSIQKGGDDYIGIQRRLSPSRVKDIQKYVHNLDATFPTSIILAINSEYVDFSSKENVLEIAYIEDVAKIIDGQHRIAGFQGYSGKTFQINVTIFIDMEIVDQAMVFSKINLCQGKVEMSGFLQSRDVRF